MKNSRSGILTVWATGLLALTLIFILSGNPELLRAAGSGTSRTLPRKYDVIKIQGAFLRPYTGAQLDKLALLASKDGQLSPIPFQIDERDKKGQYIMTRGKTARKDETSGVLDGNDELLFLISDAGDRLPDGERATRIEIEVTDPRYSDKHAWAYLAYYKAGNAPRSNVDYVDYDPSKERIISKNYMLGYRKGYMFYNEVIYPTSVGGNGKNFMDRIKFRIRLEFLGGKVVVVRNEDAIEAKVQGWIDGQIRVMQSTINYAKVIEGLPKVSFNSISEYYPHIQTSPITVRFPFSLETVMKSGGLRTIIADVVGDIPGLVGGNSYTNLYPQGFVYTGHSAPEVLNKIPKQGLVWGFATKKGVGTWFPRLVFPDCMNQFSQFYISDNVNVSNPPDDIPGEIGAGLRLDLRKYPAQILQMMSKESFMLKFETYFAQPGLTPESAREWLDIQDYPLLVDVKAGSSAETVSKSVKVNAPPPWKGGTDGTITDARNRKIPLKGIASFIGGLEVDARSYFGGERVTDASWHVVQLAKMNYFTNYIVAFDPHTKTRMATFHKIGMVDGSTIDLLGCRCCGWGGVDDEGKVIYLSNAQVQRIDFKH